MARTRVTLNAKGVKALLTDPGVVAHLNERADRVLASAVADAPFESGDYRESLHKWDDTTDRAVVRVGTDVAYGMGVEAAHGVLARALDAGRGGGE